MKCIVIEFWRVDVFVQSILVDKVMLINVHKWDKEQVASSDTILYHHYSVKAYAVWILHKLKTI